MPNHDYRRDLMGSARIDGPSEVTAGEWTDFTLVYTAGKFGIDDMGGLKVAFRTHSDMTPLQTDDPKAPGYLSVETSNGEPLEIDFSYKRNLRPWGLCITVLCRRFLKPGDEMVFRIGDRRQGSPGVRMQTHCESKHQFRVTVDAFATADYTALEEDAQPTVAIRPGPPAVWKAILPTLRRPEDRFRLIIKAEDIWGNPTDRHAGDTELKLLSNATIHGLPKNVTLRPGMFAAVLEGLSATGDAPLEVSVELGDRTVARSNPLHLVNGRTRHFWSDMHGQSGETIGSGTAREYFAFARDRSFLDITGHQGNDFQISDAFWAEINALTAEFNEEGCFLALPGYEWSGNTGLGGDHNVWYRHEGRPIYRSSRAIVQDQSHPETDCHDVTELFAALAQEDALVVPHVGGRFADVTYAHEAALEPSVEVHSSWGTFDWILHDALKSGYRVGVVAASDGHKGRPGASYPGDAKFGAYGGLTCHLMPELTRDALFSAFRSRHHYATTGARVLLSVAMAYPADSRLFARNPALGDTQHSLTRQAVMGDIVATPSSKAELSVVVHAAAPVERIELFDGCDLVETIFPDAADPGKRLRIVLSGQETRGRGRLVKWQGTACLEGAGIDRMRAHNFYNPAVKPVQEGSDSVSLTGVTTGGEQIVDLWLKEERPDAMITLSTNHGKLQAKLGDLDRAGVSVDCGGLDKRLTVIRLPDELPGGAVRFTRQVELKLKGDSAHYIRVRFEDGHIAWSSPIYSFREDE
ncbi:DUF3604 domain-containing protein [Rhodobacteraceae bacterium R_SAG2]|nr:DUF3604 domain-containing protein [Rhodobacteraceae bacterium R_SAG2]